MDVKSINISSQVNVANTLVVDSISIPTVTKIPNTVSLRYVSFPLIDIKQLSSNISFGMFTRALSDVELIDLTNNGKFANPKLNYLYKADGTNLDIQDNCVVYHLLNEDLIYEDGGNIKIKNLKDISGATDAVINSFTDRSSVLTDLNIIDYLS